MADLLGVIAALLTGGVLMLALMYWRIHAEVRSVRCEIAKVIHDVNNLLVRLKSEQRHH